MKIIDQIGYQRLFKGDDEIHCLTKLMIFTINHDYAACQLQLDETQAKSRNLLIVKGMCRLVVQATSGVGILRVHLNSERESWLVYAFRGSRE